MKTTKKSVLARNIVRLRKERTWNQYDLAEQAGLHVNVIKNLETDKTGGRRETLEAIAGALSCTVSDLFRDSALDLPVGLEPQEIRDLINDLPRDVFAAPHFLNGLPAEKILQVLLQMKDPIIYVYGVSGLFPEYAKLIDAWEKAQPGARQAALRVLATRLPDDEGSQVAHPPASYGPEKKAT